MSQSARLQLPYILTQQAQKEVTHNAALNLLDAFTRPVVQEKDKNSPPPSPTAGECYLVGDSPAGDFTGHANKIAAYTENGWIFAEPFKWLDVVNEADDTRYIYDGSGWVPYGLLVKDTGEYLRVEHLQEDISGLSGASATSTIQIPDRGLVIAVNVRVTTAITGATSFDVGISGDTGRYGTGIGIALDSTSIGMSQHPTSYYSDTALVLTAQGGNFSGGAVRLTVQYLKPRGPWDW
jgi:hypothetical protein